MALGQPVASSPRIDCAHLLIDYSESRFYVKDENPREMWERWYETMVAAPVLVPDLASCLN